MIYIEWNTTMWLKNGELEVFERPNFDPRYFRWVKVGNLIAHTSMQ